MDKSSQQSSPYKLLGSQLKQLREQLRESLAEVSGAVEIEMDSLERIEQGVERPTEDILMLLISHFNVQENEAVELWELAGYDQPGNNNSPLTLQMLQEELQSGKSVVMLMAMDMRTMYSDTAQISINQEGVVMQFGQIAGQKHTVPVARVGMSIEQAQKVLDSLQRALLHAKYLSGPKRLPLPKPEQESES